MDIAIHCHDNEPRFGDDPIAWQPSYVPEPEPPVQEFCGGRHYEPFQTWRTCSYCGSMHPHDFLHALRAGATLSVADWKYGWPHKFYVDAIPNPYPDLLVVIKHSTPDDEGERRAGRWVCGPAEPAGPYLHGKWYNTHLRDLCETDLQAPLVTAIAERTGIIFECGDDGALRYRVRA